MSPNTRRTVLMGAVVPLAGIPDFSSPPPRAAPPHPDADLIALCREHDRQWAIADAHESTDDEADAAVEATSVLCCQIAGMRATTALGLASKARVAALENGFGRILSGRDLRPLQFDGDRVAFSLYGDLIQGRVLT